MLLAVNLSSDKIRDWKVTHEVKRSSQKSLGAKDMTWAIKEEIINEMCIEYVSRASYLELMIQGNDLPGRGDEIHQLQVILDNEKTMPLGLC
jgi:hypothetical protein